LFDDFTARRRHVRRRAARTGAADHPQPLQHTGRPCARARDLELKRGYLSDFAVRHGSSVRRKSRCSCARQFRQPLSPCWITNRGVSHRPSRGATAQRNGSGIGAGAAANEGAVGHVRKARSTTCRSRAREENAAAKTARNVHGTIRAQISRHAAGREG